MYSVWFLAITNLFTQINIYTNNKSDVSSRQIQNISKLSKFLEIFLRKNKSRDTPWRNPDENPDENFYHEFGIIILEFWTDHGWNMCRSFSIQI